MIAYVAAFVVMISVAVGALVLVMVCHLAHATWFVPMRRSAEALASTLPIFFVLFLPIAMRLPAVYPWARPLSDLAPQAREALERTHAWYSPAFFVVRAYVYMAIWTAFAFALRRDSLAQDRATLPSVSRRQARVSGAGLPVVLVVVTLAAFDWMMSLAPGWTSDMFGVYVGAGAFAGAVGSVVLFLYAARATGVLSRSALRPDHVHALGRVLLVSVLLWAYVTFCQFLLVWIADLPAEVTFYDDRSRGAWLWVVVLVGLLHFGLAFLLLLSRSLKRSLRGLAVVGAIVLLGHVLDVMWIVIPSAGRELRWGDVPTVVVGLALLFVAAAYRYRSVEPIPTHDPDAVAATHYEST